MAKKVNKKQTPIMEDAELSNSEALYAFVGFLFSRKRKVEAGENIDAMPMLLALQEFVHYQKLADPRDDF